MAFVTALTELAGIQYLYAIADSFFVVTGTEFLFNRRWTFCKQCGVPARDYGRYLIVTLVNLALCLGLCSYLVDGLGIPYAIAIVVLSVAFVPVTFLVPRGWTFGFTCSRAGPDGVPQGLRAASTHCSPLPIVSRSSLFRLS